MATAVIHAAPVMSILCLPLGRTMVAMAIQGHPGSAVHLSCQIRAYSSYKISPELPFCGRILVISTGFHTKIYKAIA